MFYLITKYHVTEHRFENTGKLQKTVRESVALLNIKIGYFACDKSFSSPDFTD